MRRKSTPWTTDEEIVLAKAWMEASKRKYESGPFWKRVLEYFNKQEETTDRTVHQVNSKWKDMKVKINLFNYIYHTKMAQCRCGRSESHIHHSALVEYRQRSKNKSFPYEAAWAIVKSHPKWSNEPPIVAYIRPQMESNNQTNSSDAQCPAQINEDDEGIDVEDPERLRQKRKTPESSSSPGQQDREEQLQKIVSGLTEISHIYKADLEDKNRHRAKLEEIKLEKVRVMKEHLQRKQKEKDLQFYIQPHEHLTGTQLKAVLQYKEEIAQRWGWE